MKRILPICLLIALICVLTGCGGDGETLVPLQTPQVTTPATLPPVTLPSQTLPTVTIPEVTDATVPAVEVTEPATTPVTEPTQPLTETPYLQKISNPNCRIWSGPGYDTDFVGTVEEAGIYTIMEEQRDANGDLWGRLKSGLGWVNLTELDGNSHAPQLTVRCIDRQQLSGYYIYCVTDESEYAFTISMGISETVYNVQFYTLSWNYGYRVRDMYYTMDSWDSRDLFVAEIALPGDTSTYGIQFTASNGITYYYGITDSGLDGSLVVFPYTPE